MVNICNTHIQQQIVTIFTELLFSSNYIIIYCLLWHSIFYVKKAWESINPRVESGWWVALESLSDVWK